MGLKVQKIKVLLIEDDESLRESLVSVVEDLGCHVSEAGDGRIAKSKVMLEKYDLIISDIQMPHLNGIEFLQWFRAEKYTTPFIMITGFSNLLETTSAVEYGAQDFLAKPFSLDDLRAVIGRYVKIKEAPIAKLVVNTVEAKTSDDNDARNFRKVSIEEFIGPRFIDFSVFIKMPGNRFVKISHQGGKIDESQVIRYRGKGIHFLWIKKEDFKKVLTFNMQFAKVVGQSKVSKEKKAAFLKYTGETILENLFTEATVIEDVNYAKDYMKLSLEILTQNDDMFNLLDSLKNHTDHLYAHSLAVSVYSIMLARHIGWTTTTTLTKIGLAGLMHDIGKKEIPEEILNKSRSKLSAEDVKILESHAIRGRDILLDMSGIPQEVIDVAIQHHELDHGSGFPMGISRQQIHPFCKVISIVNRFCELTLPAPNRKVLTEQEALAQLNFAAADFFPDYFEAFKSLYFVSKLTKVS